MAIRYRCGWACSPAKDAWAVTAMVGLDMHRAARIAAAGHGGQVLLSAAARALVEDRKGPMPETTLGPASRSRSRALL